MQRLDKENATLTALLLCAFLDRVSYSVRQPDPLNHESVMWIVHMYNLTFEYLNFKKTQVSHYNEKLKGLSACGYAGDDPYNIS